MKQWMPFLVFGFLAFIVFNDPAGSGESANGFASFLGDVIGAGGEFLSNLFSDEPAAAPHLSP